MSSLCKFYKWPFDDDLRQTLLCLHSKKEKHPKEYRNNTQHSSN